MKIHFVEEWMVALDLTIVSDLKMEKNDKALHGLVVVTVIDLAEVTMIAAGDTTIVAVTATDLEEDMKIAKVLVIVEDTVTDLVEVTMIAAGDTMIVLVEVMTIAA